MGKGKFGKTLKSLKYYENDCRFVYTWFYKCLYQILDCYAKLFGILIVLVILFIIILLLLLLLLLFLFLYIFMLIGR